MRKLAEDRFLADLYTKDPLQANFLSQIIEGLNNVAKGAGVAVNGDLAAPQPVNAINVKAAGEMVHVTLTHAASVSRAIEYHLQYDTNPSFTQPHNEHLGASRGKTLHLPTFDDNGNPQKWYFRATAQYPGSPPSPWTVLGGLPNPTGLQMQGTTRLTLLPSTGSGTNSTAGQQGTGGRGKQRISTPKVIRVGKQQASVAAVIPPVANPTGIVTGSTPQVGVGQGPFAFSSTTTSITHTWTSIPLYRNNGAVDTINASPASGITVSGLTANTQYYFYPYWDEIQRTLNFTSTSDAVGTPPIAYTAKSVLAAQQQNLATHVPLSNGGYTITTPSSGTGGGSGGGGGNCFTGETRVKTPWGWKEFRELSNPALILNETGTFWADHIIHEDCDEEVIRLGTGRVNLIHGIKWQNEWVEAGKLFPRYNRKRFKGRLHNLHVQSANEADHHYIVEPGWVAHNFFPVK